MRFIYPVLFISSMIVGFILTGVSSIKIDVSDKTILSNEYFSSFDDQLNDKNLMKPFALKAIGLINYSLFNQGKKQLVIGEDGWLFSSEEFDETNNAHLVKSKNLRNINKVQSILNDRDMHLVIVPVPSKARVYSQKLKSEQPQNVHVFLYQDFKDSLNRNEICFIDSYSILKNMNQPSFYKKDTHWTSDATKKISDELVKQINRVHSGLLTQNKSYVLEFDSKVEIKGDLSKFINLPLWASDNEPEYSDKYYAYDASQSQLLSADDLFSDFSSNEEIALVGTSYSANENFNFKENMQYYSKTQVLDYSEQGVGPFLPMVNFIKNIDEVNHVKIVVWEIPERYLIQEYEYESQFFASYKNINQQSESRYAYIK